MNDKLDQLLSMNLFELHKHALVLIIFIMIHFVPGLLIGSFIDIYLDWYPGKYEFIYLNLPIFDWIYCFYLGYLSRVCLRMVWKKIKSQN